MNATRFAERRSGKICLGLAGMLLAALTLSLWVAHVEHARADWATDAFDKWTKLGTDCAGMINDAHSRYNLSYENGVGTEEYANYGPVYDDLFYIAEDLEERLAIIQSEDPMYYNLSTMESKLSQIYSQCADFIGYYNQAINRYTTESSEMYWMDYYYNAWEDGARQDIVLRHKFQAYGGSLETAYYDAFSQYYTGNSMTLTLAQSAATSAYVAAGNARDLIIELDGLLDPWFGM